MQTRLSEDQIQEINDADFTKKAKEMAANVKTKADLDELLEFVIGHKHSYSTIVNGMSSAMLGVFRYIDGTPQGGITGMQASFLGWSMLRHFLCLEGAVSLVRYENLLFPQYDHTFGKLMSRSTWNSLVADAKERLTKLTGEQAREMSQAVYQRWQTIAEGVLPNGFELKED